MTGCADDAEELGREVDAQAQQEIEQVAQWRITERQPFGFFLWRCQFMGYEFELQPGVVIPRSPIGYLLEDWPLSLQSRALADKTKVGRIVDLCSGSGCLGIIAAHNFPNAEVTLVELDAQAAELARRNVSHHGLESRVRVLEGDAAALAELPAGWDLIVSNLPMSMLRTWRYCSQNKRAGVGFGLWRRRIDPRG